MALDLVFCGTPQFAVPTFERLVESGFAVRLVLTQPDRPKGRGLELVSSPVKQTAEMLGLPILENGNLLGYLAVSLAPPRKFHR